MAEQESKEKSLSGAVSHRYGHYQDEIYTTGIKESKLPIVTTDTRKLESEAQKHLPIEAFSKE